MDETANLWLLDIDKAINIDKGGQGVVLLK